MNLISALDAPNAASTPTPEPVRVMCSSRGCHERAHWTLLWNNPKLHTPERRKTWLACDAHRASLSDFLKLRGFMRECRPVESGG